MLQARPYQKIAIQASLEQLVERKNTMLIAPTGAGKTIMLSKVIDQLLLVIGNKKRVLVLVHRNKINDQNKESFQKLCGRRTGLFISGHIDLKAQVTFGMVQTIANYIDKLPLYDVVVVDEFHHARASTYEQIILDQQKKAKGFNKDLYIFGVTATPNRGDGKSLGAIVDNYSCQITIQELIQLGYLVPPIVEEISLFPFEKRNLISHPDFFVEGTKALLEQLAKIDRKKIVIFAKTMEQVKYLEDCLNDNGHCAVSIYNEKPKQEIWKAQEKFEKGKANILINIDIATEGYDFQPIDCVVLMRAIGEDSKGLLMQMVGRGLRAIDYKKFPQYFKKDCLVLDFGYNLQVHNDLHIEPILNEATLRPAQDEIEMALPKKERKEKEPKDYSGIQLSNHQSTKILYEKGFLECFNYKDKFIQAACGKGKSIYIIDGKIYFRSGAEFAQVEESDIEAKIKDILETDEEYLEEIKNKPIEPYQMDMLLDKFDIVGCSKYRASTLIAFLANEESILRHIIYPPRTIEIKTKV